MASKKNKKKNNQIKPETNKATTSRATRSMQILFVVFSILIVLSMLLAAAAKF
jgi:hypothetical protein